MPYRNRLRGLRIGTPVESMNPYFTGNTSNIMGNVMRAGENTQNLRQDARQYYQTRRDQINQAGQNQFNGTFNQSVGSRQQAALFYQQQAVAHHQRAMDIYNQNGQDPSDPAYLEAAQNYTDAMQQAVDNQGLSERYQVRMEQDPKYMRPFVPQMTPPQPAQGPWSPNRAPAGAPDANLYPNIISNRGRNPFPKYGLHRPMTPGGITPPQYDYNQQMDYDE